MLAVVRRRFRSIEVVRKVRSQEDQFVEWQWQIGGSKKAAMAAQNCHTRNRHRYRSQDDGSRPCEDSASFRLSVKVNGADKAEPNVGVDY